MDQPAEVKTIGGALRRRGLLLLAVVLAFLVGGAVVTLKTPPTYAAEARLFVEVGETDASQQQREQLGRYAVQVCTSRTVLERARVELTPQDTTGPDELSRRVRCSLVKGTSVIAVDAEAPTGLVAARLANAVAGAIIARYRAEVSLRSEPLTKYLDAELTRLEAAIQQVRAEPVPANDAGAQINKQTRLTQLEGQYNLSYGRRQELAITLTRARDLITLVEPATTPHTPSQPDRLRNLLAALAIGLTAGLLAVLVIERFDDHVYTAEGLARATGTRLVISIPRPRRRATAEARSLPYRVAYANLLAGYPQARTIMIAAASPQDRSDLVADKLAAVAAGAGQRVLLAHPDAPPGAPDSSSETAGITSMPVTTAFDGQGAASLTEARERYDLIVFSVGSPDATPAAFSMARGADIAVLVATPKVTSASGAHRAAEALRQAGVAVVAGVLLGERPPRNQPRPPQGNGKPRKRLRLRLPRFPRLPQLPQRNRKPQG